MLSIFPRQFVPTSFVQHTNAPSYAHHSWRSPPRGKRCSRTSQTSFTVFGFSIKVLLPFFHAPDVLYASELLLVTFRGAEQQQFSNLGTIVTVLQHSNVQVHPRMFQEHHVIFLVLGKCSAHFETLLHNMFSDMQYLVLVQGSPPHRRYLLQNSATQNHLVTGVNLANATHVQLVMMFLVSNTSSGDCRGTNSIARNSGKSSAQKCFTDK